MGNRAQRIDGALAEEAIRAADLLRGHKVTIYDAARLTAVAAEKLAPYGITAGDAVDFYVAAMDRRPPAGDWTRGSASLWMDSPQRVHPLPRRSHFFRYTPH